MCIYTGECAYLCKASAYVPCFSQTKMIFFLSQWFKFHIKKKLIWSNSTANRYVTGKKKGHKRCRRPLSLSCSSSACAPSSSRTSPSLSLSLSPLHPRALLDRREGNQSWEWGRGGGGGGGEGINRSIEDAAADGGDGGGADDGEGDQGGAPMGEPPQAHPGRPRLQGRLAPQV